MGNQVHGGKRPGAGRKANPLKDIRTGVSTALKLLDELKAEKEIVENYKSLDPKGKLYVIFKLREWAYGKPIEMQLTDGNQPDDTAESRLERVRALLAAVAGAAH